ncbi:hypothetical protein DFQ28_000067 [Apophysomyces sp. BC1034]|nr:hypothetical protein DFQ29_005686 [Apophysomyces sp. BC1021]KAG0194369.1 hypothetical protein DFQ28_000067 [Apophysomyces sp. BC1034]
MQRDKRVYILGEAIAQYQGAYKGDLDKLDEKERKLGYRGLVGQPPKAHDMSGEVVQYTIVFRGPNGAATLTML